MRKGFAETSFNFMGLKTIGPYHLIFIWVIVVIGGGYSCSSDTFTTHHLHIIGGGAHELTVPESIQESLQEILVNPSQGISPTYNQESYQRPGWFVEFLKPALLKPAPGSLESLYRPLRRDVRGTAAENIGVGPTICGGMIVGPKTILTARHCFFPVHKFSHFTEAPSSFVYRHYQRKQNHHQILLSVSSEQPQSQPLVFPPKSLEYIPHRSGDIALVQTRECVFFHYGDQTLPTRGLIARNSEPSYSDLSVLGSGGGYYVSDHTENWVKQARDLSGIRPQSFSHLIVNKQLPNPWMSSAEVCRQLHKKSCLIEDHQCTAIYPFESFPAQHSSSTCSHDEYRYLDYLLKLNDQLKLRMGHPWPEITQTALPGLKNTFFVYDPGLMIKPFEEKAYFCYGDSGSPVINSDDQVVGILSSMIGWFYDRLEVDGLRVPCASAMYAVDVSRYFNWIDSHTDAQLLMPPQEQLPLCTERY